MVAAPVKGSVWTVSALGAVAAIALLAMHGERPDPAGLARFEAAGVMLALDPAQVTAVEVRQAERRWRFQRGSGGAWAPAGAVPAAGQSVRALDDGLGFLHGSAPQRVLQRAEVDGIPLSEYGLAPPRYVVTVEGAAGAAFTIEFGAVNPQGLAQYARVADHGEIILLPRFVGQAWETAIGLP